jgi:1-acyl-sn-glycerol-3-phosphate acyltransferase
MYRSGWSTAEWLGMMESRLERPRRAARRTRGLIVAANHPAMYDAMVVVARLPRGVCIMKAELVRNIFLGGGARLAGYIRNDSGRGMVRDAVECLKEGGQLVMFPEGTRTVRPPINPFKPGMTLIAHLAKAPIQTVIIESDSPYLRKGWPLLKAPPAPVVIRVRLGRRFEPQADHRSLLRVVEATSRRSSANERLGHAPGRHPELQHRGDRVFHCPGGARCLVAGVGGCRRQR